jgi:ATP-dependent RNA helicase SUPV3L1/SUV3
VLSGRTSFQVDPEVATKLYEVAGFKVAGRRAVRVDILERLADLIRPLLAWRPTAEAVAPPAGVAVGGGFTVTTAMTSLLGCSGEDFASVLRAIGYRVERKPAPPKEAPPAIPDASAPAPETAATSADEMEAATEPVVETPSAEEAPDASPGAEPESPLAQEAPPAAEPAFIEVWRPARRDRPRRDDHRRHRDQRQAQPATGTSAAAAEAAPAAAPAGGEAEAGAPRPDRGPRREGGRRDGQRQHGKRHDGPRHDRGQDRRDGNRPAERSFRQPPERREKPLDPDSPFAALAALKARLEAKDQG